MSAKMHSILFTLVILALVAWTTAFPTGSGTCNSNQTVIEGVQGQPMGTLKQLGFTFAVTMANNNYIPGGPAVKFCVHGTATYKGVLLYALDGLKNHVGSWKVPPGHKILKLNCLGDPDGTLTHSDPTPKGPNFCYEWMPPKNDVGPLSFVGTVVQSKVDGFQIIKDINIFIVKNSTNVTTATMTTTTCMQYETTKPTYQKPTYTYEKPTYTYEKPTYTYEKPTYTYEKPTYGPTYEPTYSNKPIGDFNPPGVSAANGITYTGYILLLQLMIVSSLIFYCH